MNLDQRIAAFDLLGTRINDDLSKNELLPLMGKAEISNPWFTLDSQKEALNGILEFLDAEKLHSWASSENLKDQGKSVGIVMAGNIPLVGFHDLLCVLISGNKAMVKMSTKDNVLMKYLVDLLCEIEPGFTDQVQFTEVLRDIDAAIATGSDNSARYFKEYFGRYPNIIRKNRVSCAILTGNESDEELDGLSDDIFKYFGMGCRNVSKIYIPEGYEVGKLDRPFKNHGHIIEHNKYANNYYYNRALLLMNSERFRENGFIIMKETADLVSPVSVIFYEYYRDLAQLEQKLRSDEEKLQCIVSKSGHILNGTEFGATQRPQLQDYADNINTLRFLSEM